MPAGLHLKMTLSSGQLSSARSKNTPTFGGALGKLPCSVRRITRNRIIPLLISRPDKIIFSFFRNTRRRRWLVFIGWRKARVGAVPRASPMIQSLGPGDPLVSSRGKLHNRSFDRLSLVVASGSRCTNETSDGMVRIPMRFEVVLGLPAGNRDVPRYIRELIDGRGWRWDPAGSSPPPRMMLPGPAGADRGRQRRRTE